MRERHKYLCMQNTIDISIEIPRGGQIQSSKPFIPKKISIRSTNLEQE